MSTELELRHLRREIKTALELAIVALAPSNLIDRLALVAGLLDAVDDLPANCAPAIALAPGLAARGGTALGLWHEWEKEHVQKVLA